MLIDVSVEVIAAVMILALLALVMIGFPLAFSLGGLGVVGGMVLWGPRMFEMYYLRYFSILSNYTFLAVPLFVFMGLMIEKSGVSGRLFEALYLWLGRLPGGLAIITVLIGTIIAACVGIIGASVVMLGLVALPAMLQRNYNKELACGAVCAGGSLGILIPPSVMIVLYGPMAELSVGKLFMAAFIPGLMLSGLYVFYIGVRCIVQPGLAPPLDATERSVPLSVKIRMLVMSLLPTGALILAVLGSIFFGIAAPTEAAAVGAVASIVLAAGYKTLNIAVLKTTALDTLRVTSMVIFVAVGASLFTGTFLSSGCGQVISDAVVAAPMGRWGSFAVIMVIVIILGMFIDWVGILLVMIPLVTPIGAALGFDPIWFALMIMINLQISFISPPFAYAIFYLRGIVQPEWGVDTGHIIRGVLPYVGLVAVGLALCSLFPQIVTWLPEHMIR